MQCVAWRQLDMPDNNSKQTPLRLDDELHRIAFEEALKNRELALVHCVTLETPWMPLPNSMATRTELAPVGY